MGFLNALCSVLLPDNSAIGHPVFTTSHSHDVSSSDFVHDNEHMPDSWGLSLTGFAIAVLMTALTVITRLGIWSSWMDPMRHDWRTDRLIVVFVPLFAITALGMALAFLPIDCFPIRALGYLILLATVLPWIYTVFLTFIPVPRWLFPRWAREIYDRRPFGK